MNQFLVPQFIDVEPKILGPLSLRQFIIVVVGIVFAVIAYRLADLALFILEVIIIATLVILFAFIKVNGQPFHYFLLNIFGVVIGSNTRIWSKQDKYQIAVDSTVEEKKEEVTVKDEIKAQKLSDLSLLLDTGGAFNGESIEEKQEKLKNQENNKNN